MSDSHNSDTADASPPEKGAPAADVGGWLALLTFTLLILNPFVGAGHIFAGLTAAEDQTPALKELALWSNLKAATWSGYLGFAVVSVHAGWGLLKGRRMSAVRRARRALWLVGPVATIVLGLLVPVAILGRVDTTDVAGLASPMLRSILTAAAWTAYLSMSKRVAATYLADE